MKIEGDNVIFSTGKVRSVNGGIIGLSPDLDITGGYDDGFYSKDMEDFYEDSEKLTKEELIEIADYMIKQWQKFRTNIKGGK